VECRVLVAACLAGWGMVLQWLQRAYHYRHWRLIIPALDQELEEGENQHSHQRLRKPCRLKDWPPEQPTSRSRRS
jgi:hypothetical protein